MVLYVLLIKKLQWWIVVFTFSISFITEVYYGDFYFINLVLLYTYTYMDIYKLLLLSAYQIPRTMLNV